MSGWHSSSSNGCQAGTVVVMSGWHSSSSGCQAGTVVVMDVRLAPTTVVVMDVRLAQ